MIIAIPLIGGVVAVLTAVVEIIVKVFEKIFGAKSLLSVAVVAASISLFAAFVAAIDALAGTIAVAVPGPVVTVWSWIMPANATACFSACAAGRLAHFVYHRKLGLMKSRAYLGTGG